MFQLLEYVLNIYVSNSLEQENVIYIHSYNQTIIMTYIETFRKPRSALLDTYVIIATNAKFDGLVIMFELNLEVWINLINFPSGNTGIYQWCI